MSRKQKPTLADNIRAERTRHRMNQASLAEQVGVSRAVIVAIETGKVAPQSALLASIAKVLQTTPELLSAELGLQPVAA